MKCGLFDVTASFCTGTRNRTTEEELKANEESETTTKRVNDLVAMNELSPDTTQPLDKHKATDRTHERVG